MKRRTDTSASAAGVALDAPLRGSATTYSAKRKEWRQYIADLSAMYRQPYRSVLRTSGMAILRRRTDTSASAASAAQPRRICFTSGVMTTFLYLYYK